MAVEYFPIDHSHFVYALLCQDEKDDPLYVKIGYTFRPRQRLSELRVTCPIPARHYACIECYGAAHKKTVEKALHKAFEEDHKTGEWFKFDWRTDKDKFNRICRDVFDQNRLAGRYWTVVDIAKMDKLEKERRRNLLANKKFLNKAKRNEYRSKARAAAWAELAR